MGVHVSVRPGPHSSLPPRPIPLDFPSALALSALLHALNLDCSSISPTFFYFPVLQTLRLFLYASPLVLELVISPGKPGFFNWRIVL